MASEGEIFMGPGLPLVSGLHTGRCASPGLLRSVGNVCEMNE